MSRRVRTPLALLLAAAALAAFIVFVERRAPARGERAERARRAFRVRAGDVEAVTVERGDLRVVLRREGPRWRLAAPVETRADRAAVARLLDALEGLGRSQAVSPEERRREGLTLDDYGLARPQARLAVESAGRTRAFAVGRVAPAGHAVYVLESETDAVVAVDTNLLAALPARLDDVRDHVLFPGDASRVRRVELRRADGFVQAGRTDAGWFIQQPVLARADEASVLVLVETLLAARVEAFVRDDAADGAVYGLEEAADEIALVFERAERPRIALQLGKPVDERPGFVYARLRQEAPVYAVPAALREMAATPLDRLRDRRLLPFRAEEVGSIELRAGEAAVRMERDGGRWRLTAPVQAPAEDAFVERALLAWAGARVERFLDGVTNRAERGLAPPVRTVAFFRGAPEGEPDWAVHVGAPSDPPGTVAVACPGDPAVYEIEAEAARWSPVTPLAFRSLTVLAAPPGSVLSLTLARRGEPEQRVEIAGDAVTAPAASGARIDAAAVRRQAGALTPLRALALAAEGEVDAAARFGLDDPAARLTVGLSGEAGPVKTLVLGARTPDGQYAAIRGQGLVFLLDAARADLLQRKLYEAPGPAGAAPGDAETPPAP